MKYIVYLCTLKQNMNIEDLKENESIECRTFAEELRIRKLLDEKGVKMKGDDNTKWSEHDYMRGFGSIFYFPKRGMYSVHEERNFYSSEAF